MGMKTAKKASQKQCVVCNGKILIINCCWSIQNNNSAYPSLMPGLYKFIMILFIKMMLEAFLYMSSVVERISIQVSIQFINYDKKRALIVLFRIRPTY